MPPVAAIAGGLGSALGGAFGGGTTSRSTVQQFGPASQFEQQALGVQQQQLGQLQNLVGAGPGRQDVTTGLEAQRRLAGLFGQAASSSGLPTGADISSAQGFARGIFAPQREALSQQFEDQATRVGRLSAQLGRPVNDPILQAKLAQSQGREQALLGARQGSAAQQLALALPGQRLGLEQKRASILGGLGQQAFQNRSALFGLGGKALGQERNLRTAQAGSTVSQQTGGSFGGAFGGALGGLGVGAQVGQGLQDLFRQRGPSNAALGQLGGLSAGGGLPTGLGVGTQSFAQGALQGVTQRLQ